MRVMAVKKIMTTWSGARSKPSLSTARITAKRAKHGKRTSARSYNSEQDTWTCAAGQTLHFRRMSREKTESGYEIEYRYYRSAGCEACPLKPQCTKAQGDREIKISMKYWRLKNQAREKLRSEERYALAVRRMIEPEPVFGAMKNNRTSKDSCFEAYPK